MVISGLSGAGKSSAMNVFEDAGYFCVDNLPAEMIRSLAELFLHEGSKVERAAVVCDSRGGEYLAGAGRRDRPARRRPASCTACVFLERRRGDAGQPLQGDPPPAPAGAARERRRRHPGRASSCSAPVRERADIVIDTSGPERRARCAARSPTSCSSRARPAGSRSPSRRSATSTARRATPTSRSTSASCPTRTTSPDLRPLTGFDQRIVDYVGRDGRLSSSTATSSRCWSSCSRSTCRRARRT